jgi:hypothetical protein
MAFDDDTCPGCGISVEDAEMAGIPYGQCTCGYSREDVEYLTAIYYGPNHCARCYHSKADHGWSEELEGKLKLYQARVLAKVRCGGEFEEADFPIPGCAKCVCDGFVTPLRVVA